MIFVTVGTIRFDELIKTVDRAVAENLLPQNLVVQIGNGYFTPQHCRYFRAAPTLSGYYDRAELVIGHGGTGTTLEVLERGLRLISVANPSMQDNHQHEFLEALEAEGYLWYCRNLAQLPELVSVVRRAEPRRRLLAYPGAVISKFLETWNPHAMRRQRSHRSRRKRLASLLITDGSIDLIRIPQPKKGLASGSPFLAK